MKRTLTLISGIVAIVLLSESARAEDPVGRSLLQLEEGWFDRLDVNHDDAIELDEIPPERPERAAKLIERLDQNEDGKVTREEFQLALRRLSALANRRGDAKPLDQRPGKPPEDERRAEQRRLGKRLPAEKGPEAATERATRLVGPELFRMLDSDGDGKLSREELTKAADLLMKLDRNKDGFLTSDELVEQPQTGRDASPLALGGGAGTDLAAVMIRRADKNDDGKLSKDELPARMQQRFDEMDRNHDGFVDEQELAEVLTRHRKLRGQSSVTPGGTTPTDPPGRPGGDAQVELNRERVATFLRQYDKDADGRISPSEFPADRRDEFKKLDRNGDGYLTPDELARGLSQ